MVYGRSKEESDTLRTFVRGHLRTQEDEDGRHFLPNVDNATARCVFAQSPGDTCFLAGTYLLLASRFFFLASRFLFLASCFTFLTSGFFLHVAAIEVVFYLHEDAIIFPQLNFKSSFTLSLLFHNKLTNPFRLNTFLIV